ncbi:ACP phosphodieterase [Galbibacter marinus]|uniref:FMN dependent NADH:quinone oxidoreductase n=1 Tax=Galbibacter marinus TaxID=555500 RepID=K2P2G2_9FLAO|nr:NAD(P)H-dependent oxidoreductase [Galbibacter marinus]EKF55223.1 ACP phosphodieterase [Galbibacter marinus]
MNTSILRIDSSLRKEGSYSRSLGDFFIQQWAKQNPSSTIKRRDLVDNEIDHLNQETLEGFFGKPFHTNLLELSDKLIDELYNTDILLLTVPMYNFGIPSALKAYFDLVVRVEKTYTYQGSTPGLLNNKKAYIICSMGGQNAEEKSLVEIHLRRILSYIGITDVHCFTIDSTADQKAVQATVRSKKNEIINLLNQ